jgi:ketosteroid isomerase-like protein
MRYLILSLLAFAAACSSETRTQPDIAPVVAAERAFAAEAGRRGWVEAFEAHSTSDAIVLQAGPVNAHQSLAGIDPANRGDTSLTWGPEFAGISMGGDFGFTTGPYNGGDAAFGQYFTVWRRQADGSWKWIYDGGTNQTTPTRVDANADVEALTIGARGAGSAEAAIESVRAREAGLAEAAAENAGEAYEAVFAADGRMNRDNQPTARTREAVSALAGSGAVQFSPPQVIEASANGDMVFTLGQARWEGGAGYYCRIWVLQAEGWRIGYDQILLRTLAELEAPESP